MKNRINGIMIGWTLGMAVCVVAAQAAPPPPPPGGGGGSKPPDTAPPGKIFFENNVIIVGPGFVKPDSDGGTVFVEIGAVNPGTVKPGKEDPGKTIERTVREVTVVKSQVEAGAVAMPPGLLNPAALLMALDEEEEGLGGKGIFDDPAFLPQEGGSREPAAAKRPVEPGAGGAAVQAAPDAPAPRQLKRSGAGEAVIPSYWQLPIR